jgi:arylsulfatase A
MSLVGLVLAATAGATVERLPNIVVIMADDLGYGDVSAYGAKTIKTPSIDRLSQEGLRFTAGYASASTCTPTRFSFLTGTYAFRQKGTGIAQPNAAALIAPGTETLPAILKRVGYATAVVGKWHLGLGSPAPDWNGALVPGPLEAGFDHCFVLPTTNDRVPQVFVEDHRVSGLDSKDPLWVGSQAPGPDHPTGVSHRHALKMDWSHGHNNSVHNGVGRIGFYTGGMSARFRDEDLSTAWLEQSMAWIRANRERPFFLFLASHNIHVPRLAHERFRDRSGMGPRGDCILEFDWLVGEVMAGLDKLGLTGRTLVVLCSDNGPVLDDGYQDQALERLGDHRPGGPFRGGKGTVFEGGMRTPFVVRWPGRVSPGVSDQVVSTIDLAASLAALVGEKVRADGCLDSHNVLPALLGVNGARGRDELVLQDNNGLNFGLRVGPWKLVRLKQRVRSPWMESIDPLPMPSGPFALFNLVDDPGETTDLAASHPAELARLRDRLQVIVAAGRTRSTD